MLSEAGVFCFYRLLSHFHFLGHVEPHDDSNETEITAEILPCQLVTKILYLLWETRLRLCETAY